MGFEKWTFLKMSKIENLKYFLEKTHVLGDCHDNALKTDFILFFL